MHFECTLRLFESSRLIDDSTISPYVTLYPYEIAVAAGHTIHNYTRFSLVIFIELNIQIL